MLKKIFAWAAFSRIILFAGTLFGASYSFGQNLLSPLSALPYKLAYHWDAFSYLGIAREGYLLQSEAIVRIVFPPLYPLLVKIGNFLTGYWHKSFTWPWISIAGTFERISLAPLSVHALIVAHAEALTAVLSWIIIPFMFLKRLHIRKAYAVYYALGVLMMTSTGFLLSLPRYFLSLPPFFIFLSYFLKNRILFPAWLTLSASLMIYLAVIFVSGIEGGWAF